MRRTLPPRELTVILVFLFVFLNIFVFHATPPSKKTFNSPTGFQFEIADTEELRSKGLSGRTNIPENYGMLFVFNSDVIPSFWMKDMLVPIDIIWISKDGEIVGILPNVSPATFPATFSPDTSIRYVLETKAGEAKRQGWEVGTRVWLPL